MTEQRSSTETEELRQAVALEIWCRFPNSNAVQWKDEKRQDEYLQCADDVIALCRAALSQVRP